MTGAPSDSDPQIHYSEEYEAEDCFVRHVILPKSLAKYVPRDRLMTEKEWRSIGVVQSEGWEHFMIHDPEPHILLFRRPKNKG
jgi:cyclin-dependent kinase regulatory subunit CKS1